MLKGWTARYSPDFCFRNGTVFLKTKNARNQTLLA